jgi:hypothetical protein
MVNQRNPANEMKIRIQQANNGNVLICALCTIVIVSLIGANVLINCTRHYNITAKQLKAWKEALYAAEAGGDAGFDEVRKLIASSANPSPTPSTADGWTAAPSPVPTPGPAWTRTISGFGQAGSLTTVVTVDRFPDGYGGVPQVAKGNYYYRIRATGTAKLLGLPRVGLSDQFFAGGPNFAANSATRGVGDTLLRKIDFYYDHFKATYGDGDGNFSGPSPTPLPYAQVSRRIELVAVPKFYVFGGALRVTYSFDGPGNAGNVDSYSSKNATNGNPSSPKVVNNDVPGPGVTSYYGPNPTGANAQYAADAHDGDVGVGTKNFAEGGPIWGDVTTNGGNVTHSGYHISGTIDNNVPFTIPPLKNPNLTSNTTLSSGAIVATGTSQSASTIYVYNSSVSSDMTISNGNDGAPAYATIVVSGDITGKVHVAQGVTAQIYFTGNIDVKGRDLDNQNKDHQTLTVTATILGIPTTTTMADPNTSSVGHLQFYGISPAAGVTQTIEIDPPGNIFATFYAPSADISVKGNPDIFSAIVGRSFSGNGNTGFHYDKALNDVNIGVVTDYQIASFVEDVR